VEILLQKIWKIFSQHNVKEIFPENSLLLPRILKKKHDITQL